MTITIAVAGKGGTGKTTLSGLWSAISFSTGAARSWRSTPTLRATCTLCWACRSRRRSATSARTRTGVTPGQTRQDWLGYAVRMAVEEGDDSDLLAMGRPEGQGCYCAANHMLRSIMDGINVGYD